MKKHIILIMLLFVGFFAVSQSVYIDWQQCYGGTDIDGGLGIKALDNGHLIILSFTSSDDIDVSFNHGESDFWLIETDEFGNLLWEKSFGGSNGDIPLEVLLSPDGGFILFGETWSNDGDVSGNHGGLDYWLLKTDSIGNMLWQRCLGSSMNNIPEDMDMDDDGNIYVIGLSLGVGGDVTANNGSYDYWFLKISSMGEIVWDNNLGGAFGDFGMCIATTLDGGVIVGGLTDNGDVFCDTEPFNATAWLTKLDSANNIEWQQCYGGSFTENIIDLKTTNDGGYILLALTNSNDGDVSGFHGSTGTNDNFDIWVIKTDSLGSIQWQRCLGGTGTDNPDFIKLTPEGNYIVGGRTNSNNGDVSGNHSIGEYFDQWIVKLNPQGTILWQKCIGSSWDNALHDASILSESEIIIIGSTPENNDGDVSCDFKGGGDAWMYKLIDTTVGINELELYNNSEIKVYPNPASSILNIVFPKDINIRNTTIEIIDINGKTKLKTKLTSSTAQININEFNNGLYLVKIQNDKAFITRRIIIQ